MEQVTKKNKTGRETLRTLTHRQRQRDEMKEESETLEKYKVGTNVRRGLRNRVQPTIFPAPLHHQLNN